VTVTTGQQITGINFTAPHGAWLQFRVNDPSQVLPQVIAAKGPPTLEPQLQLVVKGQDKRVHHADFLSRDSGGRNYRMIIPLNTPLGVTVTSSVAKAYDATGSPVESAVAVQAAAVALNQMTFTVQHN
jgi:hypothetical protein